MEWHLVDGLVPLLDLKDQSELEALQLHTVQSPEFAPVLAQLLTVSIDDVLSDAAIDLASQLCHVSLNLVLELFCERLALVVFPAC